MKMIQKIVSFKYNSGLKRRFNFQYTINTYSKNELVDIFLKKINERKIYTCDIHSKSLIELFDPEDLPYFAGDIDRLIFHCELNASLRKFF